LEAPPSLSMAVWMVEVAVVFVALVIASVQGDDS